MIDTMTATKTVGAICGSLLIYMLLQWVGESLYHIEGHGEGVAGLIVVDEETEVVQTEEVDFTALLAAADPAKGKKVFAKCKACHKLDDNDNGVGPHLFAIIGRPSGAVADFRYSGPMAELEITWIPDELNDFLANPKGYLPGTKMSFAGLKKPKDRANLISYLEAPE